MLTKKTDQMNQIYQQQFQFVAMNILSAEQMLQAQNNLLKVVPRHHYIFVFPQEQHFKEIASFKSNTFPVASQHAQNTVTQMVTLNDNLRGLSSNDPNSSFHMLLYAVLSILYRDKYKGGDNQGDETSHYLLQTIKCSLYSPDIDFTCIKGVDFNVETLQMKAMCARFLNLMQQQSLRMAVNRLRCAQWICHNNPIIIHSFVLLFRFILMKLQIQDAQNYKTYLNPQQSLVNLIQYFDIGYRNFSQLFLFYQQGIFLALTQEEIVVGQYFQNQKQKQTQKQQLQIKTSVKLNMIQSFLVNVDQKSSLVTQKKKGIVDSDVKLLNFMLDNSSSEQESQEKVVRMKEKDVDMETPHFNHGSQDIFAFGKKKKQSQIKQQQNIAQQFKRLILDQSDSQGQPQFGTHQIQTNEAPTPFLGGEQHFNMGARFQHTQQSYPNYHHHPESPVDELNSMTAVSIQPFDGQNMVVHPSLRKSAQHIKMVNDMPFAPQSAKVNINLPSSFDGSNDKNFYRVQSHQVLGVSNQLYELANCSCRKIKHRRIDFSSNIINQIYIPPQPPKKKTQTPPLTFPSKNKQKNTSQPFMSNTPKQLPTSKQKSQHKPSFLKNLNKNKEKPKQKNTFSQSNVKQQKNKTFQLPLTRNNTQQIKLPQKTSAIISHQNDKINYQGQSRSQKGSYLSGNKHFYKNSKDIQENHHGWQTSSNFHQRIPNYMQLNKNNNNFISNPNFNTNNTNKNQPYKFYAPVQIIAPTVYFNSPKNHTNNMVLKVNQYRTKTQPPANPQMKMHQNIKAHNLLEQARATKGIHSCSAININDAKNQ